MTVEGSDRSLYQGPLDAAALDAWIDAGRGGLGLKMAEGTYQIDPTFHAARELCRERRVHRWLYFEATNEPVAGQVANIMRASGGVLYPRERLVVVLGDFRVRPLVAVQLRRALERQGPVKRRRGRPAWRPQVIGYANNSNWTSVYRLVFRRRPKIVAAFPGPISSSIPDVVIHQDRDTDPAPGLGGDHDVWLGDRLHLESFFES